MGARYFLAPTPQLLFIIMDILCKFLIKKTYNKLGLTCKKLVYNNIAIYPRI